MKTVLVPFYALVSLVSLFATWGNNIAFMRETGELSALSFIRACFANHAAASITLDILLFSLAAFVFMAVESKRHGIRHVWVYMVLSLVVAVSVMFPLFLIARERKLTATNALTA